MAKEYDGQLELASKGRFYNGEVPDGIVKCEAWDTVMERKLLSRTIPFNEKLYMLFKACTDLKLEPKKLLLVDQVHLFYYIRCLSVGAEYEFSFECSSCEKKASKVIDLEKDLQVDYAIEDMSEPFSVTLPIKGDVIEWRMLRGEDEDDTQKYVNRLRSKGNADDDPGYFYRLAKRIVSINGNKSDSIIDSMLYLKLKGKDNLALHNAIRSVQIGVNPELEVECNWCHYPNDIVLPMDKSFFRPSGEGSRSEI